MFWPNFERTSVEEESCEKNMLLMDPSRSIFYAYVHPHARTDVPTYIIEHIELPAKLLDHFLRSNKSNIKHTLTRFQARTNTTRVHIVLRSNTFCFECIHLTFVCPFLSFFLWLEESLHLFLSFCLSCPCRLSYFLSFFGFEDPT